MPKNEVKEYNKLNRLYIFQHYGFFIGYLPDAAEHRLGSAALCVGIDRPFRLLESEASDWHDARSVLVPPGCLHETQVGGAVMAILFVEPESSDYFALREIMLDGEWQCLYRLVNEAEIVAALDDIWRRQPDAEVVGSLLDRLISVHATGKRQSSLDVRIRRIIELMNEEVNHNRSLQELADAVNLSPTRLIHLFKEEVGVPIRRFRQWRRMRVVATEVAKGATLTEAALGAGFADSSHFSRAFRSMFGITPSAIFGRTAKVQIVVA